MLLTNVVCSFDLSTVIKKFHLFTCMFRCVCPSLTDRKKRISKSYRTCRSNNSQSNCCTVSDSNNPNSPIIGDALGDEQRHLGGRRSDELCAGLGPHVDSRARPLILPPRLGSGHNHESNYQSQRPQQLLSSWNVQVQQSKRQQERPTQLFLPTKQFENGHANPKSQTSTYMEQFWICTKR